MLLSIIFIFNSKDTEFDLFKFLRFIVVPSSLAKNGLSADYLEQPANWPASAKDSRSNKYRNTVFTADSIRICDKRFEKNAKEKLKVRLMMS